MHWIMNNVYQRRNPSTFPNLCVASTSLVGGRLFLCPDQECKSMSVTQRAPKMTSMMQEKAGWVSRQVTYGGRGYPRQMESLDGRMPRIGAFG